MGFSLDSYKFHTKRHLATLQPSVPAPRRRHFVCEILFRSSDGRSLHCINLRFRSTDDEASLQEVNISTNLINDNPVSDNKSQDQTQEVL